MADTPFLLACNQSLKQRASIARYFAVMALQKLIVGQCNDQLQDLVERVTIELELMNAARELER